MSEKLLALLFRLYPPAFRQRYLHEAMLLCRDRRLHETGIYRSARLARDLLIDFLAGLPKAWQTSYSIAADGSQAPNAQPVPSFNLLHAEPLSPTSILLGCLFSAAAVTIFTLVMRATVLHSAEQHAFSPIESVLGRLNQPPVPPPQKGDRQETGRAAPASLGIQQAVALGRHPFSDSENRGESPQILPARVQTSARLLASTIPDSWQRGHTSVEKLSIKSAARSFAPFGSGVLAAPGAATGAEAQGQVKPQDATQAMIQAISSHQIVMFGETHGNKQEYQWLCRLVKTPAFADRVDDIVVEFGNSLYQKTVDRYVAGENIPQAQVEKAWRNVIGAVGPVSPVYGWFYGAVRDSNLERHNGHKIRLLLGDPYGDWSKINNAEELGPYLGHRDQWYAEVVKEDVLAHHHRALLIMGAGHFLRRNGPGFVETAIRAAGVRPYLVVFGTNAVGTYDDLDHRFDTWPLPAIVPLSGNWVGELPANPVLTGGEVGPNSQKMANVADAMLYVGSRGTLTQVFVPRSELVDTAYGKEIERRLQIQMGRTMDFTQASEGPQYQKPLHQIVSNGIHRLPPNPPKSINDPLPPRPASQ